MIREEALAEDVSEGGRLASPAAQAAAPEAQEPRGPGLLSKMLRQPSSLGMRTVSLHNLLDQPAPVPATQTKPPPVPSSPP